MIRRFAVLLFVVLSAALLISACGGSSVPPSAKTLSVTATEFAFAPNVFEAKVGEDLTFSIENNGTLDHNFVVFDPSGKEATRTTVARGTSGSVTFKVSTAGDWAIVCDVAGHKQAGMTATLKASP